MSEAENPNGTSTPTIPQKPFVTECALISFYHKSASGIPSQPFIYQLKYNFITPLSSIRIDTYESGKAGVYFLNPNLFLKEHMEQLKADTEINFVSYCLTHDATPIHALDAISLGYHTLRYSFDIHNLDFKDNIAFFETQFNLIQVTHNKVEL